ncbi:SIMPL domain-containing protein [Sphingopyxis sp.]|uniref:SIMPL domain-containing protein n=1 Tax=Sphingopyxis sp. TaxID=1908224 RepID=UPI002ED83263
MPVQRKYQLFAILALVAAVPVILAATANEDGLSENSTRLTVTGQGFDSQPVTMIQIVAGVEEFAPRASDALRRNAGKLDEMRRSLKRLGVKDEDFFTSNMTLSPGSEYEGSEKIKGFTVRHNLMISFRDAKNAGAMIDRLVDAGATNIQGPMTSWEATPESAARARAAAIKDAMERADIYARTLNMRVKRVVSVTDSSGYRSHRAPAMMRFDAGTRIDPGQENVTVSVGVVFELSKS